MAHPRSFIPYLRCVAHPPPASLPSAGGATARPQQGTRHHPLLFLFPASDADEALPADPTPKVWGSPSSVLSPVSAPLPWALDYTARLP